MKDLTYVGDRFLYRSNLGSPELWGWPSWAFGVLAGFTLAAAAVILAYLVSRAIFALL